MGYIDDRLKRIESIGIALEDGRKKKRVTTEACEELLAFPRLRTSIPFKKPLFHVIEGG